MDGYLWGNWGSYEYPQTPHLAGIFKSKADTFKARQIVTIMEKFAKERNKPIYITPRVTALNTPIDAFKFPPEAYKVVMFQAPNHGTLEHSYDRNNVGQLIDYVDMLVNVLKQLDEDYVKAVTVALDAHKTRSGGNAVCALCWCGRDLCVNCLSLQPSYLNPAHLADRFVGMR